jgi:hypothetical protein
MFRPSPSPGSPRRTLLLLMTIVSSVIHPGPVAAQQPRVAATTDAATGWDLSVTGGFVVSGLIDPVYALDTVPGRTTRVVVRETDRENSVGLSIAMFAQLYHDRLPWLAPLSFGVGIRDDGRAVFYLGPGLRLGRRAALTAGVAVGPVAALPPGVHEQQPVADTNSLIALGTRMTASWFTGVTCTFGSLR